MLERQFCNKYKFYFSRKNSAGPWKMYFNVVKLPSRFWLILQGLGVISKAQ